MSLGQYQNVFGSFLGLKPSIKYLNKIGKIRIFDPKSTQKHPESGQNTPYTIAYGSKTFFGTCLDEFWAPKWQEMP